MPPDAAALKHVDSHEHVVESGNDKAPCRTHLQIDVPLDLPTPPIAPNRICALRLRRAIRARRSPGFKARLCYCNFALRYVVWQGPWSSQRKLYIPAYAHNLPYLR